MNEIDMFDFYSKCLVPLTPPTSVNKILQVVMIGGETTEDFAQVLSVDTELQHWVRLTVQRLGFDKRAARVAQMIILLGQNRIRDLIIGRSIERNFVKNSDTLLAKLLAEREKTKAKEGAAPPKTPANQGDEASDDSETIPAIADYKLYLEYASRAEEIAISIRNSYPGQAFAGGVIFDYVKAYLKSADLEGLSEDKLKNTSTYLDEVFKDGIRSGIAANEIMQKISIPHQKNVFVTALVHNVGKALMLAYNPKDFERAFQHSTGSKDPHTKMPSDEAESLVFGMDHAQLGSLFLGRLPFLAEIERSIDYHHNPHLLRFSNPKLYALACVLSVSGTLAKLYQRSRVESPEPEKIRDKSLMASPDFQFLKLNDQDWSEIKSNYALKLMKVGY
jgi:HD-like signal output (HDOD) protein